tara:strand:+ start:4011 stop:4652 length:642 start_codon:yes stop_codon:yes gene_type:complete
MPRKQEVRRILLEQIHSKGIAIKYLLTCDYFYKQKDYNKVLLDNHYLRRTIRRFYKDDIRMIFFIERHTDPESNHYQGYHRHVLVEDVKPERWLEPTGGMMALMMNLDVPSAFGMKMKAEAPSPEIQQKLLCKAVRDLNRSVPNGYLGTDVRPVTEARGGIEGVVEYLTKQVDQFHPAYELVDVSNSDIDPKPLVELYQENKKPSRDNLLLTV